VASSNTVRRNVTKPFIERITGGECDSRGTPPRRPRHREP
jgi:hypothetical protein